VKLWVCIALAIVLALVLIDIIALSIPSTDDLSPYNPLWNGLSKLSSYTNASIITYSAIQMLNPDTSALIIIGLDRNVTEADIQSIKRFVERGGTLVVADEREELNSLLLALGVKARINGSLVADEVFYYRSPLLPIARASIGSTNTSLYLNYPSFIEVKGSTGKCLGYSSPFSFIDINGDGVRESNEPYGPFCVVYVQSIGEGTVYVISDSSIFINSMIDLGDNKRFIQLLTNGRAVYMVYEPMKKAIYTLIRERIIGVHTLLFGTWLRYPVAVLMGLAIFFTLRYLRRKGMR